MLVGALAALGLVLGLPACPCVDKRAAQAKRHRRRYSGAGLPADLRC